MDATAGAAIGASVRTMVAVESEVSMAAAYYGADAATANAIGTSAAAAASAMVAEFAVGAITGAAGVQSPFSSISNAIGGSMGSTIREDSDWKEK